MNIYCPPPSELYSVSENLNNKTSSKENNRKMWSVIRGHCSVGIDVLVVFKIMFVNIQFLNFQIWNLIFSGQLT